MTSVTGWTLNLGALGVWLLASASPIATGARDGLLSAHALQHFLIAMIAAPLVVAGFPRSAAPGPAGPLGRVLSRPLATWVIGTGAMLLGHLPGWHSLEMAYAPLLAAGSLAGLAAACAFWWPVFSPDPAARLEPIRAIPYLATACPVCTVAGIVIAFAPVGAYPMVHAAPATSLTPASLGAGGFTPALDQQVSGLILWVPGCIVYVGAMLVTLGRWYATPEQQEVAA